MQIASLLRAATRRSSIARGVGHWSSASAIRFTLRATAIAALIFACALTSAPAFASDHGGGHGSDHGGSHSGGQGGGHGEAAEEEILDVPEGVTSRGINLG